MRRTHSLVTIEQLTDGLTLLLYMGDVQRNIDKMHLNILKFLLLGQ